VWACFVFTTACAAPLPPHSAGDDGPVRRDTRVVHEPCDLRALTSERLDANADGKIDITTVRRTGRMSCRAIDLNFDGAIDSYIYYDARAKVRRRENDYDRDGRVDEISIFRAGTLREKQRATTLAGKLDTWHFYRAGRLVRTERDANGDTQIDQWWEYLKDREPKCPLIHSDVDGDGRPDPGATVDACGENAGYVPPEQYERAAGGAGLDRPEELPTEVQEQEPDAEGDP
jgi:hypothetical protein